MKSPTSVVIHSAVFMALCASCCHAGCSERTAKENIERARKILATKPKFESQARIEKTTTLKIVDDHTVYVKTNGAGLYLSQGNTKIEDRYYIDASNGKVFKKTNARQGDELSFKVGQKCSFFGRIDRSFILLKIEKGKAFLRYSGRHRNGKTFNQFIAVAPFNGQSP